MAIQEETKIKVYVALSGGVDSATAALLLKQKGYSITGVYMKTWAPPGYPCPWRDEKRDALRICAHLGIPFYMWDFSKSYKDKVVNYMVGEYKKGRTPNPDVMCNKEIKFGLFFDRAIKEGADYIATGHYARIEEENGVFTLKKAKDIKKDQSYFLWSLGQKHLSKTLMPIGDFESKKEVREIAKNNSLPVSEKKDSQGICFIGPIDVKTFIKENVPESVGPVRTTSGKYIGEHDGLSLYTKGQREGIGIGAHGPYYVLSKEYQNNTLVVAPPSDEAGLYSSSFNLSELNWVKEDLKNEEKIEVSVRYGQKPVPAIYRGNGLVETYAPLRAVTEGQSAVLYKGENLIGGGVIANVE